MVRSVAVAYAISRKVGNAVVSQSDFAGVYGRSSTKLDPQPQLVNT